MKKPKKIINDAKDAVGEFIAGLLLQYPNGLVKLANHNVVLTAHPSSSTSVVQLLSGGGSGHEPSHAGWIGQGMLSGAICGGIFASPSVSAILAAIRATAATQTIQKKDDGGGGSSSYTATIPGIVLIIKNYTGDRLNFGMACELANQEGIPCAMVVVADDVAMERSKGITGARGVAGTVLIHKVAGAAAAAGKSVSEIVKLANSLSSRMGTLGIALSSVTVPGATTVNDRLLDDNTIEIGLGIHGEAGMKQSPMMTATEMAHEMISTIQTYGRRVGDSTIVVPMFAPADELCVLVNNLGGTSNFEMSILAHSVVTLLEGSVYQCTVSRLLVGAYMTSFDMHGVSVTILNVTGISSEILEFLDAPTDAPAWLACDKLITKDRPSATERAEVVLAASTSATAALPPVSIDNWETSAKTCAQKAAMALSEQEELLTKYDTIVGDGDCGITMKRGATAVLEGLESGSLSTAHPVTLFASLADTISKSMGGTSGILLELMFRNMSSTLSRSSTPIDALALARAFQAGVDAIQLYGGATAGSRTMLDALIPAAKHLVAGSETSGSNIAIAAKFAKEGADGTALMTVASAGRSNYLSAATLEGTPDPGAVAVSIVLQAMT
jgi:triose/dihydroxyacetone kinase / FAD-AMP lyase (cyclizing)